MILLHLLLNNPALFGGPMDLYPKLLAATAGFACMCGIVAWVVRFVVLFFGRGFEPTWNEAMLVALFLLGAGVYFVTATDIGGSLHAAFICLLLLAAHALIAVWGVNLADVGPGAKTYALAAFNISLGTYSVTAATSDFSYECHEIWTSLYRISSLSLWLALVLILGDSIIRTYRRFCRRRVTHQS